MRSYPSCVINNVWYRNTDESAYFLGITRGKFQRLAKAAALEPCGYYSVNLGAPTVVVFAEEGLRALAAANGIELAP